MINDSIDILDGKIVNYGIKFVVVGQPGISKYDVLSHAVEQIKMDFANLPDFGEPFYLSKVYDSLKKVSTVNDVVDIEIIPKVFGNYSNSSFDFEQNKSNDKRFIKVPINVVMELKYSNDDIKGTIL